MGTLSLKVVTAAASKLGATTGKKDKTKQIITNSKTKMQQALIRKTHETVNHLAQAQHQTVDQKSYNMDKQQSQQRALGVGSLTEKRPSITAEELTPIVLSQLQTTSKMKEESRKLRRGSRSSNSSTPASLGGPQ